MTLTSRSSFHGMSESADVLLAPLTACLLVGGARSSTLWVADLFLSSIFRGGEKGATVEETTFIRMEVASGSRI